MTDTDVDSWTGVTPSSLTCTRGNYFGTFKISLIIIIFLVFFVNCYYKQKRLFPIKNVSFFFYSNFNLLEFYEIILKIILILRYTLVNSE